jgi:hypothetical protein
MKKYCLLWILFGLCAVYSHSLPSPALIQQYAIELGVPAEALQQLVDAYHDTTGLSNPNAAGAVMLSLHELLLMRDDDSLKVGSYYRIRTMYNFQTGKRVSLGDSVALAVDADFVVIQPRYSMADALFLVRADNRGRPRDLRLIELAAIPKDD